MTSRPAGWRMLERPALRAERLSAASGSPSVPGELPSRPGQPGDDPVDLVGWATGHRLAEGAEPLEPGFARELLATALGLRPACLAGLDDTEVEGARDRLRGLVSEVERLSAEVAIDDLTGALRRGAGHQAIAREIARYQRFGGKGVAVIFIDVDGLKRINDTEGHAAGDALLRGVVRALRERLRAYDLVIRWGGDEFVCVLPDAAREEAERTLADIEAHVRARTAGRTVSAGLAALQPGDTAESLVERADAALYSGRSAGGGKSR
jgi:diguanylate cyclase (GGDEF)-like protein